MRLGLGNNLVKTAFPIGTSPSLDLAFALDRSFTTDPADAGKALITSRRGPAAKFSRGSGATQVNAAGLIEYAPENLILPSGSATNGAGTYFTRVVTGELDPDGDTTAEFTSLATGSQARLQYTGILGFSYFSVWVKAKEGSPLPAFIHLVAGDGPKSRFDTSNWAILNEQGAIGSVEYGANGWVKLRSLFPATTASALFKIVVTDGPIYGDGIAAGKVFILGGKQVSRNPSSQHYKTTSSAFYAPRFDHDPATGASKGLLIEESRENLLARSNQFNTSPWAATAVTVAEVAGGGLDGGAAWRLTPTGADSSLGQPRTVAVTAAHTFSVWLKSDTGSNVNLSLSVYDNTAGVNRGVKPITVTTQWQRFEITTATVVAGNSTAFIIGAFASWSTGENVLAFGAQLEAGAFPTSYIPTTSGTAARSADVCSIIGGDFSSFYNQSEGTAVTKVTNALGIGTATQYPFSFSAASTPELLVVFRSGSAAPNPKSCRFASVVANSDTLIDTPDAGFFVDNATSLAGFAIKLNNFAGSLNGNLITDTTVSLPTVDRMFIGSRVDGTRYWGGHIARIQYFRKRLSNAKLQTLTAP
jgi:hypothetical protein